MPRRTIILLLVACALLSVSAGCAHRYRFTRQRYETIYDGQKAPQVEKTLGRPLRRTDREWTYVHEKPFYQAVIYFDPDARVTGTVWYYDRTVANNAQPREIEEVTEPTTEAPSDFGPTGSD